MAQAQPPENKKHRIRRPEPEGPEAKIAIGTTGHFDAAGKTRSELSWRRHEKGWRGVWRPDQNSSRIVPDFFGLAISTNSVAAA